MSSTYTEKEIEFHSNIREYLNDYQNNYIAFSSANVYQQDLVIRRVYKVFEYVNMNKDVIKQTKYNKFKKQLSNKMEELKIDINTHKLDDCNYQYLFDLFEELKDVI